ncbi:hypothetical protein [Lactiplantibacillus plantarum]|uniref:hypothetical protein n=1 Tax=Lactiplantibacillus plantarum TaxID=1590 RepID=UPI0020019870|nr:hypothetical protein [Lactiplantibacillus plantarum]
MQNFRSVKAEELQTIVGGSSSLLNTAWRKFGEIAGTVTSAALDAGWIRAHKYGHGRSH